MTKEIERTLGLNDTPTGLKESDEDVCRGYSGVAAQADFPAPVDADEEDPAFSARTWSERYFGYESANRRPFNHLGEK